MDEQQTKNDRAKLALDDAYTQMEQLRAESLGKDVSRVQAPSVTTAHVNLLEMLLKLIPNETVHDAAVNSGCDLAHMQQATVGLLEAVKLLAIPPPVPLSFGATPTAAAGSAGTAIRPSDVAVDPVDSDLDAEDAEMHVCEITDEMRAAAVAAGHTFGDSDSVEIQKKKKYVAFRRQCSKVVKGRGGKK